MILAGHLSIAVPFRTADLFPIVFRPFPTLVFTKHPQHVSNTTTGFLCFPCFHEFPRPNGNTVEASSVEGKVVVGIIADRIIKMVVNMTVEVLVLRIIGIPSKTVLLIIINEFKNVTNIHECRHIIWNISENIFYMSIKE